MASTSSASGALTKHGFPRGYRFVPDSLEIVELLAGRLNGTPLPPPLTGIFHDIRLLDHHPKDLYEAYKEYEEGGCIYFFSRQVFPPSGGGRAAGDAGAGKKRRPVRSANGGGWKPSGGAKQLKRPRHKGGGVVGRMVTMVFYEKRRDEPTAESVKTNWGMHEFTVPIKQDKFSEIAVYRLYKVKNGNKENRQADAEENEQAVNAPPPDHGVAPPAVAEEQKPPTWTAAGYPGAGTSTSNQAFVAASTSQDQKPLSIAQIQHFHNQYASFAAAGMPGPSSWVSPAAATGMPGPSSWMPPVATNPQDHASFAQTDYAKFTALPEPVTVPPPAESPGEQEEPKTAMHGGSSDQFGVTSLPSPTPAAASPVPEQLTNPAMSSPPPPAQSAGCDETMEEAPPQPEQHLPPLDEYDDMANLFGMFGDNNNTFMFGDGGDTIFTLEELSGGITMEPYNPFGGEGNNNQLPF